MSSLRMGFLSCEGGQRIPVKVKRWRERTLVECDYPLDLLSHLGLADFARDELEGVIVRGVVIPGEGGFFQLFDTFGAMHREPLFLAQADADKKFLNSLIWEV